VVALCGYLPLAIRIAASRLRHRPLWTVAHLAGLLRDEGNRLGELELGDRSVAAAFAVSYEHLGAVGRESFRLLGLFPGSTFDARAAAALTGVGVAAARKALEDLVDANLLVEHAPDRFHFHDLLRQYARTIAERDCTEAERHEAVTRLAAHYLDLAAAADHLLDPGQSDVPAPDAGLGSAAQARAVIEAEHRNFGPVLEAVGRCGAVASELAQVAGPLLLRQGYPDEALAAYRIGLAAARDAGHRSTEADLHRRLGLALIPLRRLEESLRELRAALAIEEETGNAAGAGRVHSNIGIACIRMGRFDDALANLRRGLELLREFGTRRDLVAVLVNLGVAHLQVGDYPATIECVQQVLVENEQLGNQYVEANGVLTLGLALTRMGELDQALGHVRLALALSRELGAAEMEARSLYSVADCLRLRSELDEALVDGRASLVLAREIGNRDVENHALIKLGTIHLDRGDLDAAAGCFEDSLRLNEQNRDNHTTAMAHDGLARVAHARGDRGAARERWESALAVAEAARLPLAARIREDLLSVS
jgi:tetratricopeptide (TPR) repeat protein